MIEVVVMTVFLAQGVVALPTSPATCLKAARALADGGTVFLDVDDDAFQVFAVVCEPAPSFTDKALTN